MGDAPSQTCSPAVFCWLVVVRPGRRTVTEVVGAPARRALVLRCAQRVRNALSIWRRRSVCGAYSADILAQPNSRVTAGRYERGELRCTQIICARAAPAGAGVAGQVRDRQSQRGRAVIAVPRLAEHS
jgi:hypothetical protein